MKKPMEISQIQELVSIFASEGGFNHEADSNRDGTEQEIEE